MSQPAWITIGVDEISGSDFSAAELTVLQNLQDANATALTAKLAEVVNEFRQAILDGGGQIEAAATIPSGFRGNVIALARWRWLLSFPQLKSMQTDARRDAATRAEKVLDDVATGKRKVALPPNPSGATGGTQQPYVVTRDRKMSYEDQEGL